MDGVRLRKTKVKVLEIVWAYLYSGREPEAWTELADAWPPVDQARVKAAILAARSRGIESQVAVIAKASSRVTLRKRPFVYETAKISGPSDPPNIIASSGVDPRQVDLLPRPILLTRSPATPNQMHLMQSGEIIDLTIDEAGKVWSAKLEGSANDPDLVEAARGWSFVPAFKGSRAVACMYRMTVSPER
jgi:hypothetical protein